MNHFIYLSHGLSLFINGFLPLSCISTTILNKCFKCKITSRYSRSVIIISLLRCMKTNPYNIIFHSILEASSNIIDQYQGYRKYTSNYKRYPSEGVLFFEFGSPPPGGDSCGNPSCSHYLFIVSPFSQISCLLALGMNTDVNCSQKVALLIKTQITGR